LQQTITTEQFHAVLNLLLLKQAHV